MAKANVHGPKIDHQSETAELPEKSAAPDAANVAFLLRATPHTAPL